MSKTKIGSEKYTRKCLINNGKTVSLTRQGKGATVPPPKSHNTESPEMED